MTREPPARTPPERGGRPRNRLLAFLPAEEFEMIRPDLRTIPMKLRQVLLRADDPICEIYFPNGGVASVTSVTQDGSTVEVATIGNEGLVGMDAFLGGEIAAGETVIQVSDTSLEVLPLESFRRAIDRRGAFFEAVQRYAQGFIKQIMQSTACMALHPVQERCCRWLLMTHDRAGQDTFHLSHEFLATMLGSTRPTVTVVAGTLQKAGIIRYVHGQMTILDRESLESASCECYALVRAHFDRLGL